MSTFARATRVFAALALVGVAGCSRAVGPGDGGDTDAARDVPTGSDVSSSNLCSAIDNTAPEIHAGCPTGGASMCPDCPTPDVGSGGPITDGTYAMTALTVWSSGCGILASRPARATLRIEGDSLQLNASAPLDFSASPPVTTIATYQLARTATQLSLTRRCPEAQPAFSTGYGARGDVLVIGSLPGLPGSATFVRQ